MANGRWCLVNGPETSHIRRSGKFVDPSTRSTYDSTKMSKSPAEKHYKVPELSELLQVKPDVLYAAISNGTLKAINVGSSVRRAWRVSQSAWDAYIKSRSTLNA